MRTLLPRLAGVVLPVAILAWVAVPVLAGPPLICHPVDIGEAKSLPWSDDPFKPHAYMTQAKALPLMFKYLDESEDALVHMETIRRAVVLFSGMAGEKRART